MDFGSQPGTINPMYGIPQQIRPQMMGFQHPAVPGLSEHDLLMIAHLVKSLLQQEISEQVKTKVDDATKSLQTQLDDTKSELSDTKSALDDMRNQCDELKDKVLNIQIKQDHTL